MAKSIDPGYYTSEAEMSGTGTRATDPMLSISASSASSTTPLMLLGQAEDIAKKYPILVEKLNSAGINWTTLGINFQAVFERLNTSSPDAQLSVANKVLSGINPETDQPLNGVMPTSPDVIVPDYVYDPKVPGPLPFENALTVGLNLTGLYLQGGLPGLLQFLLASQGSGTVITPNYGK